MCNINNINYKNTLNKYILIKNNIKIGEFEEQNIGVNVCAIPFAYDSMLFLLPLIIGLDILLTKCFSTSNGKYCRISFYALTLIGFVIFFSMFGYSITSFCQYQNSAHMAPTRAPTEVTITPTDAPTPTPEPSQNPTLPTLNPPSFNPTQLTGVPTKYPTNRPTYNPTKTTQQPSPGPTPTPTYRPSSNPVMGPTNPSLSPTEVPTPVPSKAPTSRDELKDEQLCSKEGYFGGGQSVIANPPNGLWNTNAAWNFKEYRMLIYLYLYYFVQCLLVL